jgi:hypothetical protein
MRRKRVSKRQKRKTILLPRCHLFYLRLPKCPEFGKKKEKSIEVSKMQTAAFAFSLQVVVVTNPKENKREDAQKLKALWWSVQKAPRAAAQNVSLSFLRFRPPKQKPQFCKTPVLFWMINVCRVRFCVLVVVKSKGIKQARSRS